MLLWCALCGSAVPQHADFQIAYAEKEWGQTHGVCIKRMARCMNLFLLHATKNSAPTLQVTHPLSYYAHVCMHHSSLVFGPIIERERRERERERILTGFGHCLIATLATVQTSNHFFGGTTSTVYRLSTTSDNNNIYSKAN